MLIVVFKKTDGTSTSLRPLQSLRFDAEELREAEGGPLLARHEGQGWDVGGAHYLRLGHLHCSLARELVGSSDVQCGFGANALGSESMHPVQLALGNLQTADGFIQVRLRDSQLRL